jgi:NitT/TauT family transport system permease protein
LIRELLDEAMLKRVATEGLLPIVTLITVVLLWQMIVVVFGVPKFIVPLPSDIGLELWDWRWRLPYQTWITFYEAVAGFLLSVIVAIPLAALLSVSAWINRAIYPLIVVTQAVPKIAIAPVVLLIFGVGTGSKVILCFLSAFFPILISTSSGLAATPEELVELSRAYHAPWLRTFIKIRFPMALPHIFSGLKVAISLAVTGAVVAEFVASDEGLGYVILSATSYWKSALAFAAMIILSVMAILLFAMVEWAEKILCPWAGSQTGT